MQPNITITRHARKRIKDRIGIPLRAVERFFHSRINSSDIVEAARAGEVSVAASEINTCDGSHWITWDQVYRVFYVWAVNGSSLALVTVIFPHNDPRWVN